MTILEQQITQTWRWSRHTFRAMNTQVETCLYSQTGEAVLLDIERLFRSFEKRLSRFDPHSELSRLNLHPGPEPFVASSTLVDALEVALVAAQATQGLYDPAILTVLEQSGYDRSFEQVPDQAPLQPDSVLHSDAPAVGALGRSVTFRSIQLNRPRREIYKPAGVRLDLGGMGKGWTVDRAADHLQGLGPFLVNAGGDIFAYQAPPGERGWQIDLVHPFDTELSMARLYLHHRALATSTIAKRRWQQEGQVRHHLIDPRTGHSAQTDALSVSVVADRTVLAEIYAKVALILGATEGLAYLQSLPGVEGLIYTSDKQILYTTGLAALLDRVESAGYVN
ncbi:MAG: FAD:protein FMN transferase [Anaerolineae bacterium]